MEKLDKLRGVATRALRNGSNTNGNNATPTSHNDEILLSSTSIIGRKRPAPDAEPDGGPQDESLSISHRAKRARDIQSAIAGKAMRVIMNLAEAQQSTALSRKQFAEAQQAMVLLHKKVGLAAQAMVLSHEKLVEAGQAMVPTHKKLVEAEQAIVLLHARLAEAGQAMVISMKKFAEAQQTMRLSNEKLVEAQQAMVFSHKELATVEIEDPEELRKVKYKLFSLVFFSLLSLTLTVPDGQGHRQTCLQKHNPYESPCGD